jgi:SAM-dependent methyltransferase
VYRLRVLAEKQEYLRGLRNRWTRLQTIRSKEPFTPAEYVERYAPSRSFVDVGGMWGVNGKYSFLAERAGATRVVLVDLDRTEEFDHQLTETDSKVEFVKADATNPALRGEIGPFDVVWCSGLLYHVPDPLGLLENLRRICEQWLILESLVIPDLPGWPNMATFYPYQPARYRARWDTSTKGGANTQLGISTDFDPDEATSNNFWGLSPSSIESLLRVANFTVHSSRLMPRGPFRHVVVATPAPLRTSNAP